MIVWRNKIGNVSHIVLYPQTPQNEAWMRRLEQSLPFVNGRDIESIPARKIYQLRPEPLTHERDEGVLHLYCRR